MMMHDIKPSLYYNIYICWVYSVEFMYNARSKNSKKDGITTVSLRNLVSFLSLGGGIPEEDAINKVITG